jgi:hypothetical protein
MSPHLTCPFFVLFPWEANERKDRRLARHLNLPPSLRNVPIGVRKRLSRATHSGFSTIYVPGHSAPCTRDAPVGRRDGLSKVSCSRRLVGRRKRYVSRSVLYGGGCRRGHLPIFRAFPSALGMNSLNASVKHLRLFVSLPNLRLVCDLSTGYFVHQAPYITPSYAPQ